MQKSLKKQIVVLAVIIILTLTAGLGLVYYYQTQGLIKIFPTSEEQAQKNVLAIDRAKFKAPNGLSSADFEARIADLEKVKKEVLANPKDYNAWFVFGSLKDYLNDHEGAVAAWEIAYQLQPNDFRIPQNLANIYQYFMKDYPKAEYNYSQVLKLRPDYNLAFQGLMDLYRFNWKENKVKYEPLVLQAIAADKTNTAFYYKNLAEFFATPENLDVAKAKKYLAELKKINAEAAAELQADYPVLQ